MTSESTTAVETAAALVTTRHAARILKEAHGLTFDRARRVLGAGLAGPPTRTSAAVLYSADRVHRLAARPRANDADIAHGCPDGVLILRLAHRRSVDVRAPWAAQADQLSGGWPMSVMAGLLLRWEIDGARGALPCLATVCGFVAFGADVRGFAYPAHLDLRLRLAPPGPWFERFDDLYLPTSPGKEWLLWGRRWNQVVTGTDRGPLGPRAS